MDYQKVVQLLGENLAAFLELVKKWLVTWNLETKKVLHTLYHLRKEDVEGLLAGTYKIVKIEGSSSFVKSTGKLIPRGTVTIPAHNGCVETFFSGCVIFGTIISESFVNVIYENASRKVFCEEHKKDNYKLSVCMSDLEIQDELGQKIHQTIDQYLASIMSRICNLWKEGRESGLLTTGGFSNSNIEYVDVGDRLVKVSCRLIDCDWYFECHEFDDKNDFRYKDSQVSSFV